MSYLYPPPPFIFFFSQSSSHSLFLSPALSFSFLFLLDSRAFTSSLYDKKRKKRGIERKNKRDGSLCHRSSLSPTWSKRIRWLLFSVFSFLFFFLAFIVMIWLILKLCFWVCILIIWFYSESLSREERKELRALSLCDKQKREKK